MTRDFIPYPWTLHCAWCPWRVIVNPRGQHGRDQGAGVEAAHLMERHVACEHGKTWADFLHSSEPIPVRAPRERSAKKANRSAH